MEPSAEIIRADFDRIAPLQRDEWDHNSCFHPFLLRQVPEKCDQCLEIGCGTGLFSRLLAQRSARVLALDLSPEMIRVARGRSAEYPNIEFVVADATAWDFSSERYDCIVSIATLHHLPFENTLLKMRQALRPGGRLLILDLVRAEGWRGWLRNCAALPASLILVVFKRRRLRQPPEVRLAWKMHGLHDSYLRPSQIRRSCALVLPGAAVRVHLFWRYSVVWAKS